MKNETWSKLEPYFKKNKEYGNLMGVLNYDIQTNCPPLAISEENRLCEAIATDKARLLNDKEFVSFLKEAQADKSMSPMQEKVIRVFLENVELIDKMGVKAFGEWNSITSKSNEMWRLYRPKNDFASWLPYWEKVIEGYKHVLSLTKKSKHKTLYDVCLDKFEPGENEETLDEVFNPLKEFLVKKLQEVLEKQKHMKSLPIASYDVDSQRKLSYRLLSLIGYDMNRGCLRESAHPFSDWVGSHDSRVTTKFLVEDWRSNAFTCLHEGGHCLEFQNWSKEQFENYADGICTAAECETHSRFFENIVGRSSSFAPLFKKACSETLDPSFKKISDEDFLIMINKVEPGLIRCEADELTYSLHIIIRYEIERDLINSKISCAEVPAIWNRKYKEYLGVDVPTDKDGCMQDVHWTDAEIGYFPSYALGNIYGAQIYNRMKNDLDVDALIASNQISKIVEWMSENDFQYDWMDPTDWIMKVTGEKMNPQYYIDYLNQKF